MDEVQVVGLDPAKHVFQVHGLGANGRIVIGRKLRRGQLLAFFGKLPHCVVGVEACASAHRRARKLSALGHDVRLVRPAYVKAYVKRGKADAADAEATSEAVTRPTMRLVAIKTREQQAAMEFHKSRDLLIRQRTMLINVLRGHLGEYSVAAPQGAVGARAVLNAMELWTSPLGVVRLDVWV